MIGSLQDRDLLDRVFKNADALHEDVAAAMQPPLATVDAAASVDEIVTALTGRTNAVLVASEGRPSEWSRARICSSTSHAAGVEDWCQALAFTHESKASRPQMGDCKPDARQVSSRVRTTTGNELGVSVTMYFGISHQV